MTVFVCCLTLYKNIIWFRRWLRPEPKLTHIEPAAHSAVPGTKYASTPTYNVRLHFPHFMIRWHSLLNNILRRSIVSSVFKSYAASDDVNCLIVTDLFQIISCSRHRGTKFLLTTRDLRGNEIT